MTVRPWNVVLADDEELSRRALRRSLDQRDDFQVVGEAHDGPSAVRLLDQLKPDLALLDVEMPGLDGFDVLRAMRPSTWPLVIFVTGHREYAVQAFEVNSLDYLLKPFDDERVQRALDRATLRLGEPDDDTRARLERVLARTEPQSYIERLPIRRQGKVEILDLESVDWIAAAGNYVELHIDGKRHLHRSPLSQFARRLDPQRFVRIHRSTVVNVERVRSMQATPQGDFKLQLDTGDELRLSRRFREALDRIASMDRKQASGG